jgi:Transposase DDE domain group 1
VSVPAAIADRKWDLVGYNVRGFKTTHGQEVHAMKYSRSEVRQRVHALPQLRFETQSLTSFSGLVLFQQFFATLGLMPRLRSCFAHLQGGKVFSRAILFMQLIVHLLLGYRELRDSRYYRDDPLVKRLLGLKRLPDVATLSRMLRQADARSVDNLRRLLRELLFRRLRELGLARITLDFDGSVQSTRRLAEGTAVGFNRKHKGRRSYYPLFCTIAQTGQVLDFLHRPGNVHDSRGAKAFILACLAAIQQVLPAARLEVRMDSAFFSDEIVSALSAAGVEFTLSVPFERFVRLKRVIEGRCQWWEVGQGMAAFGMWWKPECWEHAYHFVLVRTRVQQQIQGPVQLDLFVPHVYGYEFKAIVTNKPLSLRPLIEFHNGRGSQEGIFGELKSHCQMGYVPVRTCLGNQLYLLAGLLAHNLTRELQMATTPRARRTTAKRATLWVFERLDTFRGGFLQRAGRLTRPHGKLTLTISMPSWLHKRLLHCLATLRQAA